jgi:hypothetical protein
MRLDLIPSAGEAPTEGAAPSEIRAKIANSTPSRRNILRGLVVAAGVAVLAPFEWLLSRRAAMAGPTSEWTASNCSDAYPGGYAEAGNNWWSEGPAACFGGWRRGSFPCGGGFHFEGFRSYGDEGYTSARIDTLCGSGAKRNAWRWTAAGAVYRCSDASTTTVWNSGERYVATTIAMCRV